MRYSEVAPDPALADRVECLWSIESDGPPSAAEPMRVFPDGCIELIVHVGTPWSWRAEDGEFVEQPRAFVVGQLTRPFWLRPAAGGCAVGARMRPGGAFGLVGDDLEALADTVTPLAAVWGDEPAARYVAALSAAGDGPAHIAAASAAMQAHAKGAPAAHDAVRAAVATILEQRGSLKIAPLAEAAGWSERNFERRFAREVGSLPRTFARTVRFQHLLSLVGRDERVDWAGLAWDSGFADQAHLIREFRRFTGATPGSFADEALDLARQFVTPERLERYFRVG